MRRHIGFQGNMVGSGTAPGCALRTDQIDKHSSHRSRGYCQEMLSILPIDLTRAFQTDERFVNERRGLEGVAGPMASHVARGLTSQLGVEE
jgi:hypothetical protein